MKPILESELVLVIMAIALVVAIIALFMLIHAEHRIRTLKEEQEHLIDAMADGLKSLDAFLKSSDASLTDADFDAADRITALLRAHGRL